MSQSAFSYEVNCIYSSVPHIMKPEMTQLKSIQCWFSSCRCYWVHQFWNQFDLNISSTEDNYHYPDIQKV